MIKKQKSKLDPKKRYLQIAFNSTLEEAYKIINQIPISDRVLIEAGTPLIKRYGIEAIKKIKIWYQKRIYKEKLISKEIIEPYIVADLKTMDRGATEVELAYLAGASAVIALGHAPIETLNAFIERCEILGLDSMIDMMNVDYSLSILRQLKKIPQVVILHRGVDEEQFNKEKQIPFHEIQRIKSNYNVFVSIAGGDTLKEVQRAVFNDADIVIIWKPTYQSTNKTTELVKQFLEAIK